MKRLISVLLIALILLAGCKRAEDDIVNQNLVNDGVETSPVVSRPQAENQPEKDPAPAPEPKPETKPETKPEVKPEPKPEAKPTPEADNSPAFKVLQESVVFEIKSNTFLFKQTPKGRVVTNYSQYKEFANLFRSFHSVIPLNENSFENVMDFQMRKLVGIQDNYTQVITEEFFDHKDIVLIPFAKYRENCVYELGEVYSDGKVELNITEYWKDEEFPGNCYRVYAIITNKGRVDGEPYFEVNTKKARDEVYIDFESQISNQSPNYPESDILWESSINEVVKSLKELREYQKNHSAFHDEDFFSKYGAAFFKNNILVITVEVNGMNDVIAVSEDGTIYLSPERKSHVTADIRDYVRCIAINRNQLKGEPHFEKLTELYPK